MPREIVDVRPKLLVAVTSPDSAVLLRGQLAHARRRGFDVWVLSAPGAAAMGLAREEHAHFIPIPMVREIEFLQDLKALWKAYKVLRDLRPDVVNAGTPKAGLVVTVAALLAGVPCRVYTLRGLRLETAVGARRLVLTLAEKVACWGASRVVCISPSLRRRALELGLLDRLKAVVLGSGSSNGVDTERFAPTAENRQRAEVLRRRLELPPGAEVIGFVGRLVRDKGIVELLEAWERISSQRAGARMVIVGEFEEGDPIPAVARHKLESDPRVHMVGHLDDLAPAYLLMDVLVLPTAREGFGNVLAEAAAMERPVVATRVPGCMDAVVDGTTGLLVTPGDWDALASAIVFYLENPREAELHGKAGRTRMVAEFQPERIWDAQCDLYFELLGAAKVRRGVGASRDATGVG